MRPRCRAGERLDAVRIDLVDREAGVAAAMLLHQIGDAAAQRRRVRAVSWPPS